MLTPCAKSDTIGGIAAGIFVAFVTGQFSGNKQVQDCSNLQDQVDALKSMVSSQAAALRAASTSIKMLDERVEQITTVTISTVICGQALTAGQCGAPVGFCTILSARM